MTVARTAPLHGTGLGDRPSPARQPVDWRRLRSRTALACLVGSFVSAVGTAVGSVIAGRLAIDPSGHLVLLLAVSLVGGAIVDSIARTVWAGLSDRAEGRLRADLLDAALAQPLSELTEQAVGEILDRIDDDTHQIGSTVRQLLWQAIRAGLTSLPLWIVAGSTWWPAFFLFPAAGVLVIVTMRPILPQVTAAKLLEERAWSEHAAITEEVIAARDDLRTSLGQAHALRRGAELASLVHTRFAEVMRLQTKIGRRTGFLLGAVLALTAGGAVVLVDRGGIEVAAAVTLFLATTIFVGQVDNVARHLPDLQGAFGAVVRLRELLAAPAEPLGGSPMPPGEPALEFRNLRFRYPTGNFELNGVDLVVPAGSTCAVVGRTGSGKSTLVSLVSRAVEPPAGTVLVGGVDVCAIDLMELRKKVGVVAQRTEILAGTLAENIALFETVERGAVERAVDELGLSEWVAALPEGLDTPLGPGGAALSAGEEQLVAFARLLVRDVSIVVLDEATARMDPVTEDRVVRAADRLLNGRTGLLVAHRLTTTGRARYVAVMEGGEVVQQGERSALAVTPGPFRDLLDAAVGASPAADLDVGSGALRDVGSVRRVGVMPEVRSIPPPPRLARAVRNVLLVEPQWGMAGWVLFLLASLTGAYGLATGWAWGTVVTSLEAGDRPLLATGALVASLLAGPLILAKGIEIYPHWWVAVVLRVGARIREGQIATHRLERTPPGEVVARAMDADRLARYADNWVDFINGLVIVVVAAVAAGTPLAGGVLLGVMVVSAVASSFGRRVAGRSAAASSAARARFGRTLVSTLDSVRTVKLAAGTPALHEHLRAVDDGRVAAAVREHRIQALLDGVPVMMVQVGVVAAWALYFAGWWDLATAILVSGVVNGFGWFGRVAGSVVTEAPGTAAWMSATSRLAGGGDLMSLTSDVDLVAGTGARPPSPASEPLRTLELRDFAAVHDDGTVGVSGVDLTVRAGEQVLLLGQVGSGKSSLLGALAGIVSSSGEICWNGRLVSDTESELRPARVTHVAQLPRVLSGTFGENVALDHADRQIERSIEIAQLGEDVEAAGGVDALVGHRGVRLSGGQVQRLALARALACRADLLLADDVSSALDANTEIRLWGALRDIDATVIGATSKAAALARADRVVVLEEGRVVAEGPWADLTEEWSHLAG